MRPLLERLKSRKFLMALAAAIVAGLKAYYPDIPDEAVNTVLMACMGYVAAEAAVDAAAQLAKWVAEKKNASGNTPVQN
ncbi:MAG: hypothetical protein K6T66_06465 [Peptococcaceae bacterium]|nr:hypothetical protein [Peptococcaceae bacterium]